MEHKGESDYEFVLLFQVAVLLRHNCNIWVVLKFSLHFGNKNKKQKYKKCCNEIQTLCGPERNTFENAHTAF